MLSDRLLPHCKFLNFLLFHTDAVMGLPAVLVQQVVSAGLRCCFCHSLCHLDEGSELLSHLRFRITAQLFLDFRGHKLLEVINIDLLEGSGVASFDKTCD